MRTKDVARPELVAETLESLIKHVGRLIKKSRVIKNEDIKSVVLLSNSYSKLLLTPTDALPEETDYELLEKSYQEPDTDEDPE
jgi:hypothetical protein